MSMAQHAAIVHNPMHRARERLSRAVAEKERSLGWEPSLWFETSQEDSGRQAAQRALATNPSVVLAAGGDGTVRAVGEALIGTGVPMGLVPLGTGNLLARNLGVPMRELRPAVASAFSGDVRDIDVGRAEVEYPDGQRSARTFLVMAGIGLDASMAKEASTGAKRRFGWGAYIFPIARSIVANKMFRLQYHIDDEHPRSTRAHTVIVGNCGTLTGDMLLLPDARIDDGLLDVVLLRPKGRFEWVRIATRLAVQRVAGRSRIGREALAQTADLRALAYAQGHRFAVRFDDPQEAQLDGDALGQIIGARIRIDPGALAVRVAPRGGGER